MSNTIEKNNSKYNQVKKTFLWSAVVILIGELIVGAIMILTGAWNVMIGKIQLTFLLLGVFLFVGVNNFVRIEKGTSLVRGLAWISLISNLIWLVLGSLIIWEVLPVVEMVSKNVANYYGVSRSTTIAVMSVFSKIALVAAGLGAAGFWTSNVLAIRETVKPVKPLKITAAICELYCSGFEILIVLIGFENINYDENLLRWTQLSGLAGFAFVITALAALIISRSNREKDSTESSIRDDKQMQATIQEMVEKEVQERMKAEREKAEKKDLPPLQAEDMPPVVKRDGEVKLTAPVETEVISEESNTAVASEPTEPIESAAEIIESVEFTEDQAPKSEAPVQAQDDATSVQNNDTPNPLQ